jgi:hypothetical protein
VRTRGQVGRRFGGERTEGRRNDGRITTNRPTLTGLLEPCAVRAARTVLRGPGRGNAPRLPDPSHRSVERCSTAHSPGQTAANQPWRPPTPDAASALCLGRGDRLPSDAEPGNSCVPRRPQVSKQSGRSAIAARCCPTDDATTRQLQRSGYPRSSRRAAILFNGVS